MSENQIVPVSLLPAVGEWQMIKEIALIIGPANGKTQGVMTDIILKGRSLGLSIPASIELIQSVANKTSLAPRGALAMVHNSPLIKSVEIKRLVDAQDKFVGYECKIVRADRNFEHTSRFTMAQAHAAGLIKKGGAWEAYPENMCLWRAVGFACDVAASDITCGLTAFMKMPEQLGVVITEGGDIVEGHIIPTVDPVTAEIERLTSVYGADAFFAACDGNIPTTPEECEAIATRLRSPEFGGGNVENSKDEGEKDE